MNFLAHLYLSGDHPKRMVGNFIADFVKGRQALLSYEPEIVEGIRLHRSIDEFTDSHPIVAQSKNRLRPTYRHYSGVIVDIFYDHFLARLWDHYHPDVLPDYADKAYSLLEQHVPVMPKEAGWMLPYMIKGNWLVNYAHIDGIHRALSGMARRTPYESRMEEAARDLRAHYSDFQAEFADFFPSLQQHVAQELERIQRHPAGADN